MTAIHLILFGVLALAAAIFFYRRRKGLGSPWRIMYSPGFPPTPKMQGVGWRIDFPVDPAKHLHYVQWFSPPPLREGMTITVRLTVTGGPYVPQETPDYPPLATLLIQRKGDDWTAANGFEAWRWYSIDAINLMPGEHTLTVPLDTIHMGDVNAGRDAEAFRAALAKVDNIGIVFGAMGGRGHGVYAASPASVVLNSIEVR